MSKARVPAELREKMRGPVQIYVLGDESEVCINMIRRFMPTSEDGNDIDEDDAPQKILKCKYSHRGTSFQLVYSRSSARSVGAVQSVAGSVLNNLKRKPGIALFPVDCTNARTYVECKKLAYKYVEIIDTFWARYVGRATEHNLTYGHHLTRIRKPCTLFIPLLNANAKDSVVSTSDVQTAVDVNTMLGIYAAESTHPRFLDSKFGKKRVKTFAPRLIRFTDSSSKSDELTKLKDAISDAWDERVKISDLEAQGGLSKPQAIRQDSSTRVRNRKEKKSSHCTLQ